MSRVLAKNTLFLTLAMIGQKALAFVFAIVVARLLGPEGNGAYFFSISFAMIFGVLVDLGLASVFIRDSAQNPERRQELFSTALGLRMAFGVVMMLAVNAIAWFAGYGEEKRLIIAIASLAFTVESLHVLCFAALRSVQVLKYEALILFAGQALNVSLGALFLLVTRSPVFLAISLLVTNVFDFVLAQYAVRKHVGLRVLPALDKRVVGEIARAAAPFALAALFVKIYSYLDTVILNHFWGDTNTGYYGAAYKFTYAFQFLPMAFTAGLYPAFSSLLAQRDKEKEVVRLFERSQWYMAIIGFPLVFGVWALGDRIVEAFYGDRFIAAIPTLMTLIPVLLFIFLDFPLAALLNASHRAIVKTWIMGGTVVVNVLANLVLIPRYAEMGAAIAALLSFAFMYLAGVVMVRRYYPVQLGGLVRLFSKVILASLGMSVVVLLLKWYLPTFGVLSSAWQFLPIAFMVLCGAGSYLGLLFLLGVMHKDDVRAFRRLL